MKTTRLLSAAISIIICIISITVSAQPGGPGKDPDTEVPIDGGVSLLVAAGVAYAAKKAYDKRKKERMEK